MMAKTQTKKTYISVSMICCCGFEEYLIHSALACIDLGIKTIKLFLQ